MIYSRKIFYISLSIIVTAWKGVMMISPKGEDSIRMAKDNYGWSSPKMDKPWERVCKSMDSHTLTNLVVEWNRTDAQRGAKLMLGLGLITNMIWIIMFVIVFMIMWIWI